MINDKYLLFVFLDEKKKVLSMERSTKKRKIQNLCIYFLKDYDLL